MTDPNTGEICQAAIFVAVLGASSYTYCAATWSQSISDWLSSHVRAFEFFGGVPATVVPDNLKSGVNKACIYEPTLNPSYGALARHYGVAVIPARPRRPKDKSKVEVGVQVVERWILACLRNQRLFSLAELNREIRALLGKLNARAFKKLPGSRASAFAELDKPALRPLPGQCYEFAEWKLARVSIDYHIEAGGHYYSVPYRFARQKVDVRLTASTAEIFAAGQRIASHMRSQSKGRHTTQDAHMAPAHLAVNGWNAPRLQQLAQSIGPHTSALIDQVLHQRRHPQQGYRSCLGILSLAKTVGNARLDAACERAMAIGSPSYSSLKSILQHNLERRSGSQAQTRLPLEHANVRGPDYFH